MAEIIQFTSKSMREPLPEKWFEESTPKARKRRSKISVKRRRFYPFEADFLKV